METNLLVTFAIGLYVAFQVTGCVLIVRAVLKTIKEAKNGD